MSGFPTPVSVIEDFFKTQLVPQELSRWDSVSDDEWVDFAKTYLARMTAGFTATAMAERVAASRVRLYFDRYTGEDYDRAMDGRFARTPLISHSPFPLEGVDYRGEGVMQAVAPLAKHLLVADEIYLSDNFFRCFDYIADSFSRRDWRVQNQRAVLDGIAAIKDWLPIFAGLRELIVSGVINFVPYYLIPSFRDMEAGIRGDNLLPDPHEWLLIPDEPGVIPAGEALHIDFENFGRQQPNLPPTTEPRLHGDAIVKSWVDARLLGLDPVFANQQAWQWASGIRPLNDVTLQATSDLMSIDILPLARDKGLSLNDIVKLRKNDEVFTHIRTTLIGCKDHVRQELSDSATPEFITRVCREYVRDTLDPRERFKTIKLLDNNTLAATAFSAGVGALLLTLPGLAPLAGVALGAAITPKVFLELAGKADPKIRAAVRLEALL